MTRHSFHYQLIALSISLQTTTDTLPIVTSLVLLGLLSEVCQTYTGPWMALKQLWQPLTNKHWAIDWQITG